MKHKVTVDVRGIKTHIVKKKDTAKALGSGLADVFSTPALIALMENTAYSSIEAFLPEGYSSVGIEINVQHLKASLPGAVVCCESIVTKVDNKKIYFSLSVSDDKNLIGKGKHTRYIVNSKDFMSKTKEGERL